MIQFEKSAIRRAPKGEKMRGYYEKFRDDDTALLVARGGEHSYSAHFHRNMEVFMVKSGQYRLTVNGETLTVNAGSIAVIDSFAVHSYERVGERGDDCVLVIPAHYERRFERKKQGRKIVNPVILDADLCAELIALADGYLCKPSSPEAEQCACELILARLGEKLTFTEVKGREESSAVREILAYIEENFRGDVSRKTVARALGYSEAHVSRVFHRFMGEGISAYVNRLRHAYVQRMLIASPERTVMELIEEAGFTGVQTYYRTKKKGT